MKKLNIIWIITILLLASSVSAYTTGTFGQAIVSSYSHDTADTQGTTSTDEADANDGTINGNPERKNGKWNSSLCFDGNDYVQVPRSLSLNNTFRNNHSIEAWINTSSTTLRRTFGYPFNTTNWVAIMFNNPTAGKVNFQNGNTAALESTNNTLNNGNLIHFVFTMNRNNNTRNIYIDGKDDATGSTVQGSFTVNDMFIGVDPDDNTAGLIGCMDEFRIYNITLSGANETYLYNSTRGIDFQSLNNTGLSADTTAPTITSTSINITNPILNNVVGASANGTDETAIGSVYVAHNLTGTMTNVSQYSGLNQQ